MRVMPLLLKMMEVHFFGSLSSIWLPVATLTPVILHKVLVQDMTEDQVMFNTLVAHIQRQLVVVTAILGGILGPALSVTYWSLMLKHRCNNTLNFSARWPVCLFIQNSLIGPVIAVPQNLL